MFGYRSLEEAVGRSCWSTWMILVFQPNKSDPSLSFWHKQSFAVSWKTRKFTLRNFLCGCSTRISMYFGTSTAQLKKSNSKKKSWNKSLLLGTKLRNQLYIELACSNNLERVFSPLDQSGVSNFALGEWKIKKKLPSVSTNFINFVLSLPSEGIIGQELK